MLNTKVVSMDKVEEEDDDEIEEALLPSGSFDGSPRVRLTLADGSELLAQAAVVATEAPAAAALLGEATALSGGASPSTGRSSTCLYFAIDGPAPVGEFNSLSRCWMTGHWPRLSDLNAASVLTNVFMVLGSPCSAPARVGRTSHLDFTSAPWCVGSANEGSPSRRALEVEAMRRAYEHTYAIE